MPKKYSELKDYVNDKFYDLISNAVKNYVYKNDIDFSSDYIPHIQRRELDDLTVTSLYTIAADADYIIIRCTVYADYAVFGFAYGNRHNDVEEDQKRLWFTVDIKAKFDVCFSDVKVANICLADERDAFKLNDSATKSFVPYMSEDNLDYYAEKLLKKYYPEALLTPTQLDIKKLLSVMGLKIRTASLKGDVFGKVYFIDAKGKTKNGDVIEISRGTIVCDTHSFFFDEVGTDRNTIVHECVHWEYHKKFFDLMHLLDPSYKAIACTTVEADIANPKHNSEEFKWMEWQANALAPKILMPKKMACKKFDLIMSELGRVPDLTRNERVKSAVVQFANFFGVSKTSAKIRLLELGYAYVTGVYDYTGRNGMRTYCCDMQVKRNESFTANPIDAIVATFTNPKIREAVNQGKIVYADGFYVINSEKYVYKDRETKRYELTDYALEHVDECCLLYDTKVKLTNSFNNKYYSLCFLCRTSNENDVVTKDLDENKIHNANILAYLNNPARFVRDSADAIELIKTLPDDFNECFKKLYDLEETSFNSFSKASGLDNKTIASYYDGKSQPKSKKQVLALVSAMDIHPKVAHHLLGTLSYKIVDSNRQDDMFYCFLITHFGGAGYHEWNRIIVKAKMHDWIIPESAKLEDYQL